ncbi:hypothetical protein NE237_011997 [Protea cynaroides]|uniref:Protein TIME FOR COFFEE n=1 Tax=Protea cynaroides TaxID=273540 RepID=A0A9Q0GX58_9MAGN|nr:hypothetical protein NE237_011997 [Protea cynaroides]
MDRNREVRRGSMPAANGLSRRRHRSSSLRDSPEEDVPVELQETARLRDRGNKKDRDRDRSSRNKRRRGDRLINREDGGEDSTEESMDEEEEYEDEDSGALRMLTANPPSSSSLSNHHHQRKSFSPAKVVRASATWKVADEMIGVSVPRKARSASAKRSHECWMSSSIASGSGAEQIHRQASTSPARLNASAPSPASISPSSSNISVRRKMKPIGPKHRPPKMSKPSSSIQEDIEIEVAEVLYGLMRQSQCPSKQEIPANASQKLDSKETNGSNNEVRSTVSSPVPISPPAAAHQLSVLPQNSSTSTTSLPVVAPKRKRPRPVKLEEESPVIVAGRNGSISSAAAKVENQQPAKSEASSPKSEKNSGSASQNAGDSVDLGSQPAVAMASFEPPESEPVRAESNTASAPKPFTEETETRDGVQSREEAPSPKKESPLCTKLDVDLEDARVKKTVSTASDVECKREEKFKIDLMAPPLKSSPERDGEMEYESDPKSLALDVEMVPKAETLVTAEEKTEEIAKQEPMEGQLEDKNKELVVEESESEKPLANKERILDLQLDLEKPDKDSGSGSVSGSQQQQPQLPQGQKQQQQQPPKAANRNEPKIEKTAQSTSLPVPMTLAGWPAGLPSLGYMPPLQAVVSMDGSTGSSTPVQPPHLLSQHRPKRCATHYYIARNIYYHQQFTRINPFWPAAAGSPSMYGAKPYNLNVVPPTESTILGSSLQGSFAGRSLHSGQEKVQASSTIPGHNAKDKSSAPAAANFMDVTQRKQLVLQQAQQAQPAAAGNLMHGPAFIFPMSQQQQAAAAAAAASRSGAVKSGVTQGNAALPGAATNSGPVPPVSSSSTAAGTATTVSFNYPNLPANEAQYLAILQNNGYPFPIPAHVGAPPPYRGGNPGQAMSFFNGSFYSSQMIHPSQLQQQAQQQQAHSQPQLVQQGHQNTSTSSGSSSSHKHQQAHQQQQQRLQAGGSNSGVGNSYNFPGSKNRLPMQQQQQQQQQQNHPVPVPNQSRHHEAEGGGDSPSTADSRISHARKSIYAQNFAVPIHPQNYALMSSAALGGSGSGNHGEKQPQQQQSTKGGVELLPTQAFAMPFPSFNGAATGPGLDFSSLAQNHAIFQTLPEAARHGYQIAAASAAAAAAQAAQQKKNHHISEEGKTGGDSINVEDERKGASGKAPASVGQSLAFSRPDSTDPSVSTVLGNAVIDGSGRTLNLISAPISGNRVGRATTSTSTTSTAAPASSPSSQHQQQHPLIQLQKQQQQQQQQQLAAAMARGKTPTSSNVNIYSDRIPPSSSTAAKFPNALSVFPQALVQSSSPAQSPQWKNSARTTSSPAPSPSLASTSTSSLKNLPQQQSRTQQGQTHISFGVNPKPTTAPQGQQIPMNNQQSPSSPVVVGSPPPSSISKGAGGSPRTSSTGGGKAGSSPALPSQQPKSSSSGPSRKSSPVGGRNVPSILSNSHMGSALSSGGKPQSQSQVQQQLQKQSLQQPQIYFANAYMQSQSPQATNNMTTSSNSATAGYYHQRRQSDQQQGALTASSSGMLAMCPPLTLAGASTSDPAKAAAAAAANGMKGGMPPSGLLHAAQFSAQTAGNSHQLLSTFPYLHAMPTISMKPAEQKQPAGNDNLHACWQPEKR